MKQIKPIETNYKGYRFRSRLEARWAVFFDALGIEYWYEPEGFETCIGIYLPDFLFPQFQMFAEVKPFPVTETEYLKCFYLHEITGLPVLLLEGLPANRAYPAINCPGEYSNIPSPKIGEFSEIYHTDYRFVDWCIEEGRLYSSSGCDCAWKRNEKGCKDCYTDTLDDAINKARSARFEHGETP